MAYTRGCFGCSTPSFFFSLSEKWIVYTLLMWILRIVGSIQKTSNVFFLPHFGRRSVRGAGHVNVRIVVTGCRPGSGAAGRSLQTSRPFGSWRPVTARRWPVRGDRVLGQSSLAVFACWNYENIFLPCGGWKNYGFKIAGGKIFKFQQNVLPS